MRQAIRFGLQPALLVGTLVGWQSAPDSDFVVTLGVVAVLVVLGTLESVYPAREDWTHGVAERGVQILAFVVLGGGAEALRRVYADTLDGWASQVGRANVAAIWPHEWPGIVQLLMVFFLSELLWYWVHRAEHRWAVIWRASGHGAHHAFKKLGALNSGLNHPFELFLIVLPSAIVGFVFDVGAPAAGAGLLLATQAAIAHSNLDLNSRGIGWLFTTNRFHIHHHSVVLRESNTNYGCAAILWDRVFGTFEDADTAETGTGPTEPSAAAKLLMPFVEPSDTATAPE